MFFQGKKDSKKPCLYVALFWTCRYKNGGRKRKAVPTSGQENQPPAEVKGGKKKSRSGGGRVGGLAVSLPHGSVAFECARHELHATTAVNNPNRLAPRRIGKSSNSSR